MQHSPEQVGRQIGELILAAKEEGVREAQEVAQNEIKEVQDKSIKPVVEIDVKSISKAIEDISFDTESLEGIFNGLVSAVGEVKPADLSGVEKAISEASSKQSIDGLTKTLSEVLEKQTEAILNTQALEALSENVMLFAESVGESIKMQAEANKAILDRMEVLQMSQIEVIEAQYARADLILDENRDPIAVQKVRPAAN